ncbi:MAG: DNA-methyltransferase, partial [Acidimicrobiales bacterium]
TDEFLDATLDVWDIRPESARRVQHPAPFPIELPQRLIELFTFTDDLVLDPFLGSGTTAVAAVRTGRRYVGYDTDPGYIRLAQGRVDAELRRLREAVGAPSTSGPSTSAGSAAPARAAEMVEAAGFTIVGRKRKVPGLGLEVSLVAEDQGGEPWYFDVTGAFTSTPAGLVRTDTLWRALGRASVLASRDLRPLVLLSSHLPPRRSAGDRALRAIGPVGIHDVMGMLNDADGQRLAEYARGGPRSRALPGFWSAAELG